MGKVCQSANSSNRNPTPTLNRTLECELEFEDVVGLESAKWEVCSGRVVSDRSISHSQSRVYRSRPIALIDDDKAIALAAVIVGG